MVAAVVGYAIGTIQVLGIDWVRERWKHARQLRLLRADLRNAATYHRKFSWERGLPPANDWLPRAPIVSPNFQPTLADTNFALTDEHQDDNSQEALLILTDGFHLLETYAKNVNDLLDKAEAEPDPIRRAKLGDKAFEYTVEYDRRLDEMMFLIGDALRDLDRRIGLATIWRQLHRPIGKLPTGANPAPLRDNDPRVAEHAAPSDGTREPHPQSLPTPDSLAKQSVKPHEERREWSR